MALGKLPPQDELAPMALAWSESADAGINEDIDKVQQEGEDHTGSEDLSVYYEKTRRDARVMNFLRSRVDDGDAFVIRLLAQLEDVAQQDEDPEVRRAEQFDDLNYTIQEFIKPGVMFGRVE